MSKGAILLAALTGVILLILGSIFEGKVLEGNGSAAQVGISLLGVIVLLIGVFISCVAWILAIAKTVKLRQWSWLIVCIILGVLGSLIYGIFGPDTAEA